MLSRRSLSSTTTASLPVASIIWAAMARVLHTGTVGAGQRHTSPAVSRIEHRGRSRPCVTSWRSMSISASRPIQRLPSTTGKWRTPAESITRRASISLVPGKTATARWVINVLIAGSAAAPCWCFVSDVATVTMRLRMIACAGHRQCRRTARTGPLGSFPESLHDCAGALVPDRGPFVRAIATADPPTFGGGRERRSAVVHLSELHTLDRAECIELLRTVTVGRIAFTERGLPAIQPVNFSMDGSNVIIRTSSGGKLAAAVTGAMVAFETDEVDAATRSGWSVVVMGHASLIRDIDELVAVAGPDSQPWVPGRTNHVIRIKTERITGRRIVPG